MKYKKTKFVPVSLTSLCDLVEKETLSKIRHKTNEAESCQLVWSPPCGEKPCHPILEFVLESRTLLPESGLFWGLDSQSAVDWKAGELWRKFYLSPWAFLFEIWFGW